MHYVVKIIRKSIISIALTDIDLVMLIIKLTTVLIQFLLKFAIKRQLGKNLLLNINSKTCLEELDKYIKNDNK